MKQNNDQQLVSELMKPRVKCIGYQDMHYPGSPFGTGKILTFEKIHGELRYEWFEYDGKNWITKSETDNYPHLFKPLQWWEEREREDMPDYIRIEDMVVEVDCYVYDIGFNFYYGESAGYSKRVFNEYTIPATLSEYTQYLSQIKPED